MSAATHLSATLSIVRNATFCPVLLAELVAGLSELKEGMLSVSKTRPLSQMLTQDCHSDQVEKAEIKVATFIVEHNLFV